MRTSFKKTSTDYNQLFWNLGNNNETKTKPKLAIAIRLLETRYCSNCYEYGLIDKKVKISNINDAFCLIKGLN